MKAKRFSDERFLTHLRSGFCILFMAMLGGSAIAAEPSPTDVMRVEEDWRVVLTDPDGRVDSPQFHTAMSPYGNLDSQFVQVVWNYRESPFTPGGLQLQVWSSEWLLGSKNVREERLSGTAETVTWTQVLAADGTRVSVEVTNGQSTTWGPFGGSSTRVTGFVPVANLNQYSTDVSAESSWVSLGSNRVQELVITEVRRFGINGLLSVDSTPKVVFSQE
jgi:hypothetical protein